MRKDDKKEIYEPLMLTCIFLRGDIIRTSYGNDGNTDGDWEDDNVQIVLA